MKEMKTRKNNLDERQEQILLKIEHNGFWLAFWLLLAVMIIQEIAFGGDIRVFGGECLILLVISVYVTVACLRNGIWDRKIEPKTSTHLIISLLVGLGLGVVNFLVIYHNFSEMIGGCIAAGAAVAVFSFALCFLLLTLGARAYKKRSAKLNEEPEGEE